MKVFLCDIPVSPQKKFGALQRFGSAFPPFNLMILGSELKKNGNQVHISTDQETYEDIVAALKEFAPQIIGVTFMTLGVPYLRDLLSLFQRVCPHAIIIAGGYHCSLFPAEILRDYPEISIVFEGEAELTLPQFAQMVEDSGLDVKSLKQISGIYFRDDQGEVVHTEKAPLFNDLDKLAFVDFDIIPNFFRKFHAGINRHFLRTPQLFFLSSRGCPFSCRFCGRQLLGRTVRQHSVDYTIELIKWNKKKHGIRSIIFGDEFFTANQKHAVKFCDAMHQSGLAHIKWCCSGRVNNMDLNYAKTLKKAGCEQIGYGCETGSQRILDILDKKATLERMEKAIRDASEAGLQVFGNFMLGSPGETQESLDQTYAFIMKNPLHFVVLCFFTPLPGSYFWENQRYKEYGEMLHDDFSKYNLFSNITFIPRGLTSGSLLKMQKKIYRDFYFRPSRIAKEFKYVFNPDSWHFLMRAAGLT